MEIQEKWLKKAEKKMGIRFPNSYLEGYIKSDEKVILKLSSPNAEFDEVAAIKMIHYFNENNIPYERDPECTLNRTIWISKEDFWKNFGPKLWGWRVVRDYSFDKENDDPEWNRQGNTYRDYQGGKFRYRLKDDDGNTMYIIESDIDPDKGTEGQLFAPLDWAMNDVGCTSIEYKDKEGNYKFL